MTRRMLPSAHESRGVAHRYGSTQYERNPNMLRASGAVGESIRQSIGIRYFSCLTNY